MSETMADHPALLDVVELLHDVDPWPAGTSGTVVEDLGDAIFLVELVGPDGSTEALLDLPAHELCVAGRPPAVPVAGD